MSKDYLEAFDKDKKDEANRIKSKYVSLAAKNNVRVKFTVEWYGGRWWIVRQKVG